MPRISYGTTIAAEPQMGGAVAPRRCASRRRRTRGEHAPGRRVRGIPWRAYARGSRPGPAVPPEVHRAGGLRPRNGDAPICGSGRPLLRRRQAGETPQSALLESRESTLHSGRRRLVGALTDRPAAMQAALRNCRHKPCRRCGCFGPALTPTQSVKSQGRPCGEGKACGLSR